MGCKITYKGQEFKNERDFNNYLISQITKKRAGAKLPPKEIAKQLTAASEKLKKLRKEKAGSFVSPSSVWQVKDPYSKKDERKVGEFASRTGTRYHEIAENVIHNLNAGKGAMDNLAYTDENKKKRPVANPLDVQWAERVAKLYKEVFNPDGKHIVIPELTVGNSDRNITGDIDVTVITPEGKVKVYDYKAGLKDYEGKTQHATQQMFYKVMLQQGDLEFGIPMLEVDSVNIIPVKLVSETAMDSKSTETHHELDDHDITAPVINIEEDTVRFPDQDVYAQTVAEFFTENKDLNRDYNQVKLAHQVNFKAFNDVISQLKVPTEMDALNAAAESIRRDEDGNFYYMANNKKQYFKHKDANQDNQRGYEVRLTELRKKFVGLDVPHGSIADDFIKLWKDRDNPGNFGGSANSTKEALRWIRRTYGKASDTKIIKANTLPGLEAIGDDMVLIYSNKNPETGEYGSVDILAIAGKENELEVQAVDKRKNLAAHLASDYEVDRVKQNLGLYDVAPFSRTLRSERFMRIGLAAMALHNANPKLRIGTTATANFVSRKSPTGIAEASLENILGNIKLFSNLKVKGNKVTENSSFGGLTKQLLEDDKLLDASNYKQSRLVVLFNAVSKAMQDESLSLSSDAAIAAKATSEENLLQMLSEGNRDTIEEVVWQIEQDRQRKQEVLGFISRMMDEIEDRDNYNSAIYMEREEYKLLSQAALHLDDMIVDIDKATDLSLVQGWLISPGDTHIPIINDYIENVKIAQKRVSLKVMQDFYPRKISAFDKLFKADEKNGIGTKVTGTQTKIFEPLFEYKDMKISGEEDSSETKKIRTGRFWPKGSPEYENLSTEQKKFIDWFNKEVKEHIRQSLPPKDRENIDEYWKEGWIPYMNSSRSNVIHKVIHKGESDSDLKERIRAGLHREGTLYENHDEYMNVSSKQLTQLVDFFGGQVAQKLGDGDKEMGTIDRTTRLGYEVDERGNYYALEGHHDIQETNLERIITALAINRYRMQELSPLMIQYKSIRTAMAIAKGKMDHAKFSNAEKMLKIWSEKVLLQKNQYLEQKSLERALLLARGAGSSIALGWNLFSQLKNTISGAGHTTINFVTEALAEWDRKKLTAYRKAYKEAFALFKGGHRKTEEKINSVMVSMVMGDMDPESLGTNFIFQRTGRNIRDLRGVLNQVQDYGWRSLMLITEMKYDGTWEAYKKHEEEGEMMWVYDEDLDPRFKGKEGEALKKRIKERMVEEKVLESVDDRMPFPYTIREQLRFREKANETFEPQNIEDKAAANATTIGKLLMPMRGWLTSKVRRWWKPSHMNIQGGRWEKVEIKEEDGSVGYDYNWKGQVVEGIAQSYYETIVKPIAHLFKGGTKEDLMSAWQDLPYKRRENLIRGVMDMGVAALLMLALRSIFDDDERDTLHYSLLAGAINEVSLIEHARGFGDLVASPFPTISIFSQLGGALFGEDEERRTDAILRASGVGKIPLFVQQASEGY